WKWARQRLRALQRESSGAGPRTLKLALSLREPYTGKTVQARGAVALSPPNGLRMILLGPGGTTALDFWMSGDRHRFAVPSIDLVRRGDGQTPPAEKRGLPVDFLRWWLLRPMQGSLLWYGRRGDAERFVLRDGRAIVRVALYREGRVEARR